MSNARALLLLHGGDPLLAVISHRLRRLGYRVLAARCPEDAIRLAAQTAQSVGAVLIPPELSVEDLGDTLRNLRAHLSDGTFGCLVVGSKPDPGRCDALRAAGVELAAWSPCEDSVLRFQVNRALRAEPLGHRANPRVPTDLPAWVSISGRSKPAMVRALSATGAFLETRRPSMPGADLAIEFSVSPQTIQVTGQVVYANVPGNLQRKGLPTGMAIRFKELSDPAAEAIRDCVAQRERALVV